jgi:hypothetical protein
MARMRPETPIDSRRDLRHPGPKGGGSSRSVNHVLAAREGDPLAEGSVSVATPAEAEASIQTHP